jgi:hypothetical protein
VAVVRTGVPQILFESINRVKRISELGTTLAATEAHCEETLTIWKESAS